MMAAYRKRLTGDDRKAQIEAARPGACGKARRSRCCPSPRPATSSARTSSRIAFARIENHYFVHAGWLEEGQLIRDAGRLQGIPGVIVHGRYDMPCPASYAWALHKAWPEAEFHLIEGAGHAYSEPGILDRLIRATDRFRGERQSRMTQTENASTSSTRRCATASRRRASTFPSRTRSPSPSMLDEFGIDYVEGGYPGANPTDTAFFAEKRTQQREIRRLRHDQARRRLGLQRSGPRRAAAGEVATPICFVAKSWDYHVRVALGCTNEENLDAIRASVEAARGGRQGGDGRLRAFLRRLQGQSRTMRWPAPGPPTTPARAGWCCATPMAARSRRRCATSSAR